MEQILGELFFPLKGGEPSSCQDETNIRQYIDFLEVALKSFQVSLHGSKDFLIFSTEELKLISSQVSHMKNSESLGGPKWFPKYGCALVSSPQSFGNSFLHFRLIGLEGWYLHMYHQDSGATYTSSPQGWFEFEVGDVSLDTVPTFIDQLSKTLEQVKNLKGEQRSAAEGGQGHQKTPAFIHALIRQTLRSLDETSDNGTKILPFGGTCDVGRHSGGLSRMTTVPLVNAVLSSLLNSEYLGEKVVINAKVQLIKTWFAKEKYFKQKEVSRVFQILDELVVSVVQFYEKYPDSSDLNGIRDFVEDIRKQLNCIIADIAKTQSLKYCIDGNSTISKGFQSVFFKDLAFGMNHLKEKASHNESFNFNIHPASFSSNNNCFSDLFKWLLSDKRLLDPADRHSSILAITNIESFFFVKSAFLLDNISTCDSAEEFNSLDKIVSLYIKLVDDWILHNGPKAALQLQSISRSRQLVVIWIAFCLVHCCVKNAIPTISTYRIPLNPADLSACVIAEKSVLDALSNVIIYISKFNNRITGPAEYIFH